MDKVAFSQLVIQQEGLDHAVFIRTHTSSFY